MKAPLLLLLLSSCISMAVSACTQDRLAGCERDIIVENEIPDLVMHLGDETFRRDLVYEEPVVFRQTAGNIMGVGLTNTDNVVVTATLRRNDLNGQVTVLEITPKSIGESFIEVIASDDCLDRRRSTEFKVTVLENEDENND